MVGSGDLNRCEGDYCRKWIDDGYIVAEHLVGDDYLEYVWNADERSIGEGSIVPPQEPAYEGDTVPGRVLNPHFSVGAIEELMQLPEITRLIELPLCANTIAFQSISGHKASQQAVHSDSIHMTTYPQGYLVAIWIAFEDIDPHSGPLTYYPGSHRLPYLFAKDVGIPVEDDRSPNYGNFDALYTPEIECLANESGIRPAYFHAKRGDVLFWHANLIHGGSPRHDAMLTRKAFVFHYFAEGCLCYHDLSGGPSWLGDRTLNS